MIKRQKKANHLTLGENCQRLMDLGWTQRQMSLTFLDSILYTAVQKENIHKIRLNNFADYEIEYLDARLSHNNPATGLEYRPDDVFNTNQWSSISEIRSFADASAYVHNYGNTSIDNLINYIGSEDVLNNLIFDFTEGIVIEPLDRSSKNTTDANIRSYYSALKSLGSKIQEDIGLMIIPGDLGVKYR